MFWLYRPFSHSPIITFHHLQPHIWVTDMETDPPWLGTAFFPQACPASEEGNWIVLQMHKHCNTMLKKTQISIWWFHSGRSAWRASASHRAEINISVLIQSAPSSTHPLTFNKVGQRSSLCESNWSLNWNHLSLWASWKHADGSWAILARVCGRIKGAPGWRCVQLCADIVCLCVSLPGLSVLWKHLADMQSCADLLSNVHRSSVPVHYVIMFYLATVFI